jgi:glucose repression mediator protein
MADTPQGASDGATSASIAEGAPPTDGEQQRLAKANEVAWLQVAALAEEVNDLQKASDAYKHVLEQNDRNVHALLQLASISRMQERFNDAVEYLNRILKIDGSSGEVHGAIGHCYLTLSQRAEGIPAILECLKSCNDAYQEASRHLGAYNDPNLWYGIGLLYERYGALMDSGSTQRECYQAAEEALRCVLQEAPHFEKRAEILYRCAPSSRPLEEHASLLPPPNHRSGPM